uniref:Reverse transcriptase/retrotransposon-derived protein RNase H-like domain-containing protein n=1 Tax=Solanum lycopersicum TaxID=4081 RepID=A0A3Q7G3D1_SOLLC
APYGAPVMFQKKKDGTRRMRVDYRALNKATVKNKYPVPLVQDLMDRLSEACCFTKLDPREGYWQEPNHVKYLRSFLGLANYYKKFIVSFTKRVATLTHLLKKDTKWVWSERFGKAFQNLKEVIASKPILKLPDFELPFEVHTDASDKFIGGMLLQEVHLVAFKSQKLNDVEQIYSTYEKEMVVVES